MEIDPGYVDTIVRRFQAHTGIRAKHAVTATPFDDTEAGVCHVKS
jgi:hypothetical protein